MTMQRIRAGWVSRLAGLGLLAGAVATSVSCGEVARTGRSPVFLIIDGLEAASGASPDDFGSVLFSDVQTIVEDQVGGQTQRFPTTFSDIGRATFRAALRNPGTAVAPLGPSTLNEVTLTRYRVTYLRADGRNTPGVHVPHAFDGAATITVPATGSAALAFDVVRIQAKREPPLSNLQGGGGANIISAIAEIHFFGHDQAGNEVTVSGMMSITFGDFADPS
jgi:hypothetical protein